MTVKMTRIKNVVIALLLIEFIFALMGYVFLSSNTSLVLATYIFINMLSVNMVTPPTSFSTGIVTPGFIPRTSAPEDAMVYMVILRLPAYFSRIALTSGRRSSSTPIMIVTFFFFKKPPLELSFVTV